MRWWWWEIRFFIRSDQAFSGVVHLVCIFYISICMFCLVSNPPLVWHLVSRDISTICITFGSDIWYLTTYLIFVCHLVSHYVSGICMASGISLHIQYFVWNLVSHYMSAICMASGMCMVSPYVSSICMTRIGPSLLLPIYVSNFP